MQKYDYFTDIEDNATLKSDKSAISVLQKAVFKNCLLYCLLETKAINSGVWGRAPGINREDAPHT